MSWLLCKRLQDLQEIRDWIAAQGRFRHVALEVVVMMREVGYVRKMRSVVPASQRPVAEFLV